MFKFRFMCKFKDKIRLMGEGDIAVIRQYSYNIIILFGSVLLLSFSLISCTERVDEDKFIDAYIDIRIAEDTVKGGNQNIQKLKADVLRKHSITERQYRSTFEYYNSNPELWEQFYNKAIARVDTLKKGRK